MSATVYISIYSHRYGVDVNLHASEEDAMEFCEELAEEWWSELNSSLPCPTENRCEEYFNLVEDESFDVVPYDMKNFPVEFFFSAIDQSRYLISATKANNSLNEKARTETIKDYQNRLTELGDIANTLGVENL